MNEEDTGRQRALTGMSVSRENGNSTPPTSEEQSETVAVECLAQP